MKDLYTHIGTVIAIEGENAIIAREELDTCHACSIKNVCHQRYQDIIEVKNTQGFKKGEQVEINISGASKLKAAFLIFFVPVPLQIISLIIFHNALFWAVLAWIPLWLLILFIAERRYKKTFYMSITRKDNYEDTLE